MRANRDLTPPCRRNTIPPHTTRKFVGKAENIMIADLTKHRFGLNYTPARAWWYCWNDFSADAIARDLDTIAELGADHIRIMLVWPYFQPNPKAVSEAHLDRLDALMRLARDRGIDVCVTLFVGWLSGYSFQPPFQNNKTFYDLAESRVPQELYLARVAERMKGHKNFLGIDLGNELNCCWSSDRLETADTWSRHMLALAEKLLPDAVHVNGADHNPWFMPATFSPGQLAKSQKVLTLHCWPFFTDALRRGGGDCFHPRSLRLIESMAALARSYAGDPRKPVWVQEFGMSEEWTDPVNIPRFLEDTTLGGIRAGVNWFTWWSSHDLDRRYEFASLEYSLGLITQDQKIKPAGYAFKEIAEAYRGREVAIPCAIGIPAPPEVFDMDHTWEWLDHWLDQSGPCLAISSLVSG